MLDGTDPKFNTVLMRSPNVFGFFTVQISRFLAEIYDFEQFSWAPVQDFSKNTLLLERYLFARSPATGPTSRPRTSRASRAPGATPSACARATTPWRSRTTARLETLVGLVALSKHLAVVVTLVLYLFLLSSEKLLSRTTDGSH